MKVIKLPPKITALIFDMDLTLYTNPEYGRVQIDNLVKTAGACRGLSFEETSREIENARRAWEVSHNGKKPSLSSIILSWGFTMEDNVAWREKSYEPEKYLSRDENLRRALLELSCFALGVVTNNPVSIAKRTLVCLGVDDCFSAIVGLDTLMVAKPHRLPFEKIMELLGGCYAKTCVSVGDRYDIDLDIPLEMGMGAIQVDGVEDVYELPGLLRSAYGQK